MREKAKLISMNSNEYPNIEIECKKVDDIKGYVQALIENLKSKGKSLKKAKKMSVITAYLGEVGQTVDTRPRIKRDGKIYLTNETKGTVKVEGSMIVKNPDGEEYIVKPDVFFKKYKHIEGDKYMPVAEPIDYIILSEDISFTAPWGEKMFAFKGAVLNVTDLDNIDAIQNEAFEKTYTVLNKENETEF